MNLTYLEIDHQRSTYHSLTQSAQNSFMERLVLSWLYHDHALDGVVLTPGDLDRALNGMPARNYCEGMVLHSLRALKDTIDFVHKSAERGDELTIDWLREVHIRLCPDTDETAGRYRKRDTSPGVYHLDVAPANSISYHFHKFVDTFHQELSATHPVRQAGMAHHDFMRVFPFDERTGMVGRLMLNFILLKNNFPPAIIHATDRHLYFGALNGHRSDLVPVVADAVRSTISAAHAFTDTTDHDHRNESTRQRAAF